MVRGPSSTATPGSKAFPRTNRQFSDSRSASRMAAPTSVAFMSTPASSTPAPSADVAASQRTTYPTPHPTSTTRTGGAAAGLADSRDQGRQQAGDPPGELQLLRQPLQLAMHPQHELVHVLGIEYALSGRHPSNDPRRSPLPEPSQP
jgi:hypothetical protein